MRFEIQTAWVDGYKGRTFGTAPDAATMLAAVMAVSAECVAAKVRGGAQMAEDFIGEDVHRRAFEKWGAKAQLMALNEELCEAAAAVARLLNGKGDHVEVVEELVDVESLRLSLRDYLGPESSWEAIKQQKRRKLLFKLENGVRRVPTATQAGSQK